MQHEPAQPERGSLVARPPRVEQGVVCSACKRDVPAAACAAPHLADFLRSTRRTAGRSRPRQITPGRVKVRGRAGSH